MSPRGRQKELQGLTRSAKMIPRGRQERPRRPCVDEAFVDTACVSTKPSSARSRLMAPGPPTGGPGGQVGVGSGRRVSFSLIVGRV